MASCFSSAEEREATRRSFEIDQHLKEEKTELLKQTKILLLGPSESGKSTFWKLTFHDLHGSEEQGRLQLRSAIYCTVLDGMVEAIRCMKRIQIRFQYPRNKQKCSVFKDWPHHNLHKCVTDVEFSPYVEPLMSLWEDEGIQEAVRRADLHTPVSTACSFIMQVHLKRTA